MTYEDFLHHVITDGIQAAKTDYTSPEEAEKLQGSLEGFDRAGGKSIPELLEVFRETRAKADDLMNQNILKGYWRVRCAEFEIEWVLNCLSAFQHEPLLGHLPTARGFIKACEVLAR